MLYARPSTGDVVFFNFVGVPSPARLLCDIEYLYAPVQVGLHKLEREANATATLQYRLQLCLRILANAVDGSHPRQGQHP